MRHTLFCVRHGNALPSSERTEAQKADPPLSTKGHGQAQDLKERIMPRLSEAEAKNSAIVMVSSPMQRCLHTALPTASAKGRPLLVHAGMFEYGCAGLDHKGSTSEEITAGLKESYGEVPLDFTHFKAAEDGGGWGYHGSLAKA